MQAESVTILKTKLYMPPIRRDLVARQRLLDQLNDGLWQDPDSETPTLFTRKLTILSTPAGFGKTTLVRQWLADLHRIPGLKIAWLSVDEDDNDPVRFLRHLVAAIQTCLPDVGSEAAQILQSPQLALAALPSLLLNNLVELSVPLIVVLDDYHFIETSPVHSATCALIEGLPPQVHVVIATRADPPFPLARWRSRRQLVELRLVDLRLDRTETNRLLNQLLGRPLPESMVSNLLTHTEGWIAGLQMAALAMRVYPGDPSEANEQRFVENFTHSNRFILDYLIEEVLQRQPAIIQAFLLQTSILDRLCASLCDTVMDGIDIDLSAISLPPSAATTGAPRSSKSQAILAYLDRANLFLVPLDSEQRWYRYHQMFADLLQKQLLASQADLIPVLHRRASQWLESAGLLHEAVEHSLAAGDLDHAASLIEHLAESLMLQAELQTFLRWLEKLPEAILQSHPILQVYRAWILAAVGHPLQEIETLIASLSKNPAILPGYLDALAAIVASMRGQLAQSADLARSALKQLPSEALLARAFNSRILGLGLLANGDISEGIHFLEETIQQSLQSGRVAIAVRSLILLADLYLRLTQLHQAQACYVRAIAIVMEEGLPFLPEVSEAHIGLGELLLEYNLITEAEQSARQGIQIAQKFQPISAMRGYVCLARLKQAQNDPESANEYIAQAVQIAEKYTVTHVDDLYVAMIQTGLWIEQGRLDAAAGWINQRGLQTDRLISLAQASEDTIETHYYKYEALVVARWLLVTSQAAQALRVLDAWLPRLEQTGRISLAMELKLLRALALFSQGSPDQAVATLNPLLQQGQAQGYVRRFLDAGPLMGGLLRYYAAHAQIPATLAAYVQNLLELFPSTSDQPAARHLQEDNSQKRQAIIDALSPRELEVLKLLCTSLSVYEITAQLFIAESTLRSHIKSIYNKLGVHSRLEAIQQAKDLGLI